MAQIAPGIFDFNTDLVNYVGVSGMLVKTNAGSVAGDGLGGDYEWRANSTATHDGNLVIKMTSVTTGRWLKKTPTAPSNIPVANLLATDLVPLTQRINTVASAATITVNVDTTDQYNITALATNATIAAPTGTPLNGQPLIIRIKSDASVRTITWNAIFNTGTDFALPTATVASKTFYIQFLYNAEDVKWNAVGLTSGL